MRKWNVQTAAARATRVHARPPLARRGRATAGSNLLDNTCHICGKTFSNEKILAVHIKAVHKGMRSRARAPHRRPPRKGDRGGRLVGGCGASALVGVPAREDDFEAPL